MPGRWQSDQRHHIAARCVADLKTGETAAAATSTEADGRYQAVLKPGTYHLSVTFSGFAPSERDLTLEGASCGQTIDLQLTLLPRSARTAACQVKVIDAAAGKFVFPRLAMLVR